MKLTLVTGALAASAALAVAFAANAETGAQCFNTHDVKEMKRVSPREITVRTNDNRSFRVITRNDCRSSGVNDPLVINTGGASGRICRPVDLTLSSGVRPNTPCLVDSITPIATGEAAPAHDHPKP